MPFISLTTDFGGSGGVMRGVIWSICPQAHVADLTLTVPPQDVKLATWLIDQEAYFFPQGSVHVVVVDPGVGTQRRPIAVSAGGYYFVGPDNGVFSSVYQRAIKYGWPLKIVHTSNPKYWLPKISNIFHGRDIFSPVAAHLANGEKLEELGEVIDDPVRMELPQPLIKKDQVQGEIILLYPYLGNIISNIHQDMLPAIQDPDQVKVSIGTHTIQGLSRTFGEHPAGTLIALFGSTGLLMISVVNGSAVDLLQPVPGDPVKMLFG